ncbi:pyridoxamine 5'-phosphate oxidase family protein [Roseivirga thermotolerans]|uniref:Pyridoxamine 5'-phosphate oxidase n=1 Tax=Roseivirga thermotolerans TaxID=1758176 RepID=A0ABQ3I463_9BACT|nr:pyridoxamine 5'-phosphate oxidase family protein [Roseivirga thermotolerans]GHE62434.1 pyridoxamine 5'-phosphate oxidase [Roseivirga thermotolerans]
MAKFYDVLSPELIEFIKNQKVFFTGTAAPNGRVNVSPKGMDSFRVLGPNKVAWLNLTGSGNETAAHLKQLNRITIMFCAFEGKPLILRLFGSAKTIHPQNDEWAEYLELFPEPFGARNIFVVALDSVQTSCGFGVPLMEYKDDRKVLTDWAERKGEEGIKDYWKEKNQVSIDGFPTGLFD